MRGSHCRNPQQPQCPGRLPTPTPRILMPPSLYQSFESARRGIFVPLAYKHMCGDWVTAILFAQIAYLCGDERNLYKTHGEYWLVRERQDWERECDISITQFDRSRDVLETLGLIRVRKWKCPLTSMRPVLHFQINEAAVISWMEQNLQNYGNMISRSDETLVRYREEVKELISTTATAPDGALEKAETVATETGQGKATPKYEKLTAEEWYMKAVDRLAMVKDRTNAVEMKPVRSSLSMLWKKRMALLYPGEFVPDLTGKEQGQLGHLLRSIGNRTPDTVDWAMQNWGLFTNEVLLAGDAKGIQPAKPDVGYLLAHHALATNLMGVATTPVVDKPVPVVDTAPPASIPLIEKLPDTPVPLSEVEAFMQELQELAPK